MNSQTSGVANLANVFGVDPISWLEDWTVSVYTDDTGLPVDARYRQPSWDFRSILGPEGLKSAATRQPLFPVFPLEVVQLESGPESQAEFGLKGGGAAFLRFRIDAGGSAAIRTTSGGAVGPEPAPDDDREDPVSGRMAAPAGARPGGVHPAGTEPPDSVPGPVAMGEPRTEGTVRVVGSAPMNEKVVLRPSGGRRRAAGGAAPRELRELAGAEVAVDGPDRARARPARRAARCGWTRYEILSIDGRAGDHGDHREEVGRLAPAAHAGGRAAVPAGGAVDLRARPEGVGAGTRGA